MHFLSSGMPFLPFLTEGSVFLSGVWEHISWFHNCPSENCTGPETWGRLRSASWRRGFLYTAPQLSSLSWRPGTLPRWTVTVLVWSGLHRVLLTASEAVAVGIHRNVWVQKCIKNRGIWRRKKRWQVFGYVWKAFLKIAQFDIIVPFSLFLLIIKFQKFKVFYIWREFFFSHFC